LFELQGIVRALREFQQKLIEGNVNIYVRRAGPNYQEGLRIMREIGKLISIDSFNVFFRYITHSHR